ncbi:MAG: hypothetical protein A2Y73_08610 [Chloroflexi bacterium RBG_13_56_8]|nr:MAG: hypothetical protein A2Y73_08610 [Chloroflexi bacterium RBG_13_56_8]
MKIFTIGFTKKSAQDFFTALCDAGVKRVIDVRLNNVSQLVGFAKKEDLRYFLQAICGIDYVHMPQLAPTQEILSEYRKNRSDWATWEERISRLIAERKIEDQLEKDLVDHACLLCSEHEPDHCHRRLIAEYLRDKWGDVEIEHLV